MNYEIFLQPYLHNLKWTRSKLRSSRFNKFKFCWAIENKNQQSYFQEKKENVGKDVPAMRLQLAFQMDTPNK
jgi:hypothetical protein